ncbi:MAG: LapA family protein [Planctomycetota bacterium]
MKRVKLIGGILLGFFFLVLILQNTETVSTRVLSATFQMPLALTLLACIAGGFGLGWLACWYRHRRRVATPAAPS